MTVKHLILLLFPILLSSSCGRSDDTQWEYRVLKFGYDENILIHSGLDTSFYPVMFGDPTSELNKLGQEGWELVSTYTTIETKFPNFGNQEYVTGIRNNTRTGGICFVFKRIKTTGNKTTLSDTNTIPHAVEEAVVVEEAVDSVECVEDIHVR